MDTSHPLSVLFVQRVLKKFFSVSFSFFTDAPAKDITVGKVSPRLSISVTKPSNAAVKVGVD